MFDHLDDPVPFEPDNDFRAAVHVRVRRRRRRRRWTNGAISFVTVVVLVAASFVAYEWQRVDQVQRVHVAGLTPQPRGAPYNILLVGADAGGPSRHADTIMLVRIDEAGRTISAMSLPRDLLVRRLDGTLTRIGVVYEDGVQALVDTITADFDIEISRYVEVQFDGFRDLVDAVGGLRIDFPVPARDTYSGLAVDRPGCRTLDGDQALAYVRSRHYEYLDGGTWHEDARADLGRIARQQAALFSLFQHAQSAARSPGAIDRLVDAFRKHVVFDAGFSTRALVSLARFAASVPAGNARRDELPLTTYIKNSSPVLAVTAGANDIFRRYGAQHAVTSDNSPPIASTPAPLAASSPCS
jgi:LCP family protein required for cell wall assembly